MSSDNILKNQKIERVRTIVFEDYERMTSTSDPFVILNLPTETSWDEATARYERYERFYRAENFQRLGDVELTRKAMDIRRIVGRAIIDMQDIMNAISTPSEASEASNTGMIALDPNAAALADIYYRDGLTFLKLGDLDGATDCFRTGCDYDPTRGILLAYRAYTTFRKAIHDPLVVDETRRSLYHASRMDPTDADVWVLIARYHLKLVEALEAEKAIERVRLLNPKHPKLSKLLKHQTQ